MIRRAGHGNDQNCLDEDAEGKRIHGKTGRVHLGAEEIEDTLLTGAPRRTSCSVSPLVAARGFSDAKARFA